MLIFKVASIICHELAITLYGFWNAHLQKNQHFICSYSFIISFGVPYFRFFKEVMILLFRSAHLCLTLPPIFLIDEIAPQLLQKIANSVPGGVSGVLTVKTESWNSKDDVTRTSQKTESWGGSRHNACFLFIVQ